MNKYLKNFLQRGLVFGGFGPIVVGIVLFIIQLTGQNVVLEGGQILIMVVSSYILAFVQAGASVFNQIEGWPIAKSVGIHFISLYCVYVACYLINSWIPLMWEVILIFTAIFVVAYLVVWLSVFLAINALSKKLNGKLKI